MAVPVIAIGAVAFATLAVLARKSRLSQRGRAHEDSCCGCIVASAARNGTFPASIYPASSLARNPPPAHLWDIASKYGVEAVRMPAAASTAAWASVREEEVLQGAVGDSAVCRQQSTRESIIDNNG